MEWKVDSYTLIKRKYLLFSALGALPTHIIQKYNNTYKVQMNVITRMYVSAHLLLKYGKSRNESKSIAIFDGPLLI